ncbi:hypothetical protein [Paenibacillus jilunlii]|nr:hypothetical protein [Paenibacillus jilunlii]
MPPEINVPRAELLAVVPRLAVGGQKKGRNTFELARLAIGG